MKASELIEKVKEIVKEHGDLDVNMDCGNFGYRPVKGVYAYDEGGGNPTPRSPAVEVFLHF